MSRAGNIQTSKGNSRRYSNMLSSSMYLLCIFHFQDFQLASSSLLKLALNLQFGSHGSLEQHGFARNKFWSIDTDPPPFPTNSKSFIDLILKPSEEDTQKWPYRWSHFNLLSLASLFINLGSRVFITISTPYSQWDEQSFIRSSFSLLLVMSFVWG
jgi:hypothetical protein